MSFYNQSSNPGGGFYNSGGYGDQYSQQSEQKPQQSTYQSSFQHPQQAGNFQQWAPSNKQNPQSHQSAQPVPPQQMMQQQQQPGSGQQQNFWNSANTMAVAGLAAQAMSGGMTMDQMINFVPMPPVQDNVAHFNRIMLTLRAYFAVDNRYVQLKMKKVLFPFLSKQWRRMNVEGPDLVNYALPHSDENAPDLYLPVMSLITYCLLCALTYGTSGKFNPEVIPDVTTKCFITQVLEVALIRFGFYMMNAPTPILDLFSYTGYKYLGLTMNMICAILLGHLGYGASGFYVTFLWTASAATFFMLKTMANNIPTETASTGPKREVMVLAFAVSQAASMWFVSQTKFL